MLFSLCSVWELEEEAMLEGVVSKGSRVSKGVLLGGVLSRRDSNGGFKDLLPCIQYSTPHKQTLESKTIKSTEGDEKWTILCAGKGQARVENCIL